MTQPIAQPLPHRLGKFRLAARPMGYTLHPAGAQLLATDLLHVAQTDAESPRQFFFCSLALLIRQKNPAAQIISVRLRHTLVFAEIAKKSLTPNLALHYYLIWSN